MSFLQEKCSFGLFTRQQSGECKPFHCGDDDLDEFFLRDAFLQSDELLCKNYCFTLDEDPAAVVAAFTLSNDSIKKIPGSRKKKVERNIPREKLYSSYPAVMIGRLGISSDFQSQHLGSDVLSSSRRGLSIRSTRLAVASCLSIPTTRSAILFSTNATVSTIFSALRNRNASSGA